MVSSNVQTVTGRTCANRRQGISKIILTYMLAAVLKHLSARHSSDMVALTQLLFMVTMA